MTAGIMVPALTGRSTAMSAATMDMSKTGQAETGEMTHTSMVYGAVKQDIILSGSARHTKDNVAFLDKSPMTIF